MKLCKDCKHFSKRDDYYVCGRPREQRQDCVTGALVAVNFATSLCADGATSCYEERASSPPTDDCGVEGQFFEAKH